MTKTDHAVVIGAGVAGLCAARVLADHYQRITVVERDPLPATPTARPHVPQGRHLHVLLTSGARYLDQLFPGIETDLVAAGAPTGDVLFDSVAIFDGHRLASGYADLP